MGNHGRNLRCRQEDWKIEKIFKVNILRTMTERQELVLHGRERQEGFVYVCVNRFFYLKKASMSQVGKNPQ